MQGYFIMCVTRTWVLLLPWFSHWLQRPARLLEVNLKPHLWATPVFLWAWRLLYFSDGVNVACYCTSSVQNFKQSTCQISSEDCVKLWPSVMKQQLGKEKWKLDVFSNLTSLFSVSGLLQSSGICLPYRILFIWSLLSATSTMQIAQSNSAIKTRARLNFCSVISFWPQLDLNKSGISVSLRYIFLI